MINPIDGVVIPLCIMCGKVSPYGDICDSCIRKEHTRNVNWSSRRGVAGQVDIDFACKCAIAAMIVVAIICLLTPSK